MKDTHQDDNLKWPIRSYQEILREYNSLSRRSQLSEIEAKQLENILEIACHDSKLALLIDEINEAIFQEQVFEQDNNLRNEVARVLELIDGNIPTHKIVFEQAKLNLVAYEPLIAEYYQLLQKSTLAEDEAIRLGQILDATYKDELLTLLIDTVNEQVMLASDADSHLQQSATKVNTSIAKRLKAKRRETSAKRWIGLGVIASSLMFVAAPLLVNLGTASSSSVEISGLFSDIDTSHANGDELSPAATILESITTLEDEPKDTSNPNSHESPSPENSVESIATLEDGPKDTSNPNSHESPSPENSVESIATLEDELKDTSNPNSHESPSPENSVESIATLEDELKDTSNPNGHESPSPENSVESIATLENELKDTSNPSGHESPSPENSVESIATLEDEPKDTSNPAPNSPLADGSYLYGQQPVAAQLGSIYMVFQLTGRNAVGAFYMPSSSFHCFSGTISSNRFDLTVIDSHKQTSQAYSIAVQAQPTLAAGHAAAGFSINGYTQIDGLSELDQHILETCQDGQN